MLVIVLSLLCGSTSRAQEPPTGTSKRSHRWNLERAIQIRIGTVEMRSLVVSGEGPLGQTPVPMGNSRSAPANAVPQEEPNVVSWNKHHEWDLGEGYRVTAMASSSDGYRFAFATVLAETQEFPKLLTMTGPVSAVWNDAVDLPHPASQVLFSPDGELMVCAMPTPQPDGGSGVGRLQVIDRSRGQVVAERPTQTRIVGMSMTSLGKLILGLAGRQPGGGVKEFEFPSLHPLRHFSGDYGSVIALAPAAGATTAMVTAARQQRGLAEIGFVRPLNPDFFREVTTDTLGDLQQPMQIRLSNDESTLFLLKEGRLRRFRLGGRGQSLWSLRDLPAGSATGFAICDELHAIAVIGNSPVANGEWKSWLGLWDYDTGERLTLTEAPGRFYSIEWWRGTVTEWNYRHYVIIASDAPERLIQFRLLR